MFRRKFHCTPRFSPNSTGLATTVTGLQIIDNIEGTGASPKSSQRCVINCSWLEVNGAKNVKFDSSFDRGKAFEFSIAKEEVIKEWDEGIATMRVAGNRTLIVPPDLGYGPKGLPGTVSANAWLIFDIDLVRVKYVAAFGSRGKRGKKPKRLDPPVVASSTKIYDRPGRPPVP